MARATYSYGNKHDEKPLVDYTERRRRFKQQGVARRSHAATTEMNLRVIEQKWNRYCEAMDEDPLQAFRNCEKEDCMTFLTWILDCSQVKKRSSLCQYWKTLRVLHRGKVGRAMDQSVVREVNDFIDSDLKENHELDLSRRDKPVLHVNDLLLVLHHHWALDEEAYPDERQRVQLSTLLLTAAYTACRPSSLVYTTKATRKDGISQIDDDGREVSKTLCYKHIKVLLLRNENPEERDVMVMEVDLTIAKGDRTISKPKKFLLHEHHVLAFCPIAHILALAIADDAFEPQIARNVESLFHAEVRNDRLTTQLRFKASMQDVPIFRQATRSVQGIRTSPDKALRYHVFNDYLQRLGRGTGFREILTAYCVRRGTGNSLDNAATEAVRNQVMGHQNSQTFQYYLNERVNFDVQAAFLGTPAKQALVTALGSMSRSLDRRAPTKLSPEQRAMLRNDPNILHLRKVRDHLSGQMKGNSKSPGLALNTGIHKDYVEAQRALNAARRHCATAALREAREEYFRTVDTRDLDAQFSRLAPSLLTDKTNPAQSIEGRLRNRPRRSDLLPESPTQHHFRERSRLAELLFEDISSLSKTEQLARRIETITNMAALCHLREVKRQQPPRAAQPASPVSKSPKEPLKLTRVCLPNQCIFCLGDTALPDKMRVFEFSCAPAAKRHMRKQHLERVGEGETIRCPHPLCEGMPVFEGVKGFKIHAARVHKVKL